MVSDTVFRTLLPPELRKASNNHEQSCCCFLCVFVDYLHAAQNRFRPSVKKKLEKENNKYQSLVGILSRNQR